MKWRAVFIVVLCICSGAMLSSEEQNIRHFRENNVNITEGWIDASAWANQARTVLTDYAHYKDWGIRWMDGKDPHSAAFWVYMTDFQFTAPDTLDLYFDLNMGWPFGSKGNRARFHIDHSGESNGVIHLVLEQPPFGLDASSLTARVQEASGGQPAKVFFRLEMHIWGIVEALMDFEKFHATMGWRINRLQENLKDYIAVRK